MKEFIPFERRFRDLLKEPGIDFEVTDSFQQHQLFAWLAWRYAPCSAVLSTYSIGEHAARAFHYAKDSKQVEHLSLILDQSAKANKKNWLFFAENALDEIAFASNHSKLMVFHGHRGLIAVHGSANFTKNHRTEAFCLVTEPTICKSLLGDLNQLIANSESYVTGGRKN